MIKYFKIFEGVGRIPRKSINGIYYHGFSLDQESENTDLFNELKILYDWEAIWVTEEETISEEFSEWKMNNDDDIKVVYQVQVKSTGIADIDYQTSQNILDEWGISDFRESIDILKRQGFKGWCTPGSIDNHQYEDIALFYPNEQTKIVSVKLFMNDDWSDYMDLDKAQEIINQFYSEG